MNNNVEILRAILFTKEDLFTITNLGDTFTEKEIEFMVEFKKIYELGLDQLKKFIDKLEDEGDDLDTYTIVYYMDVLRNGPLGSYIPDLTKDKKKYWLNTPDNIGMLGNKNKAPQNVTIYVNVEYPLIAELNTYNRLPEFMHKTSNRAIQITEDMFRISLISSSEIDNTLPIADKAPQKRYDEEPSGEWVLKANASYMVKDRFYYLEVDAASDKVFEEVKSFLGDEENFRIYRDQRDYSAFDSEKNQSKTNNMVLEKEFTDGENKQIIKLDMMGDEFDSEEKRSAVLKITNPIKDEEFILNTNQGQLGN